ncbi:ABC transporter substrate-binding protein [Marinomonas algarum]|uniref:ABC transporter substrate-binding protein n=1 Tax=Marinomonas algarum TaxID=2883105 RepID=UPI0021F61D5F|nr:ABC transporter substrate-binding protein [Marinomonas algarum]
MVRNDDWYLGTPKYQDVIITKLSPQMTSQEIFKGNVDVASIPYNLVDLYKENGVKVISAPSNHPIRMIFERSSYFSSVNARQAIAYALDKTTLSELSYQGHAAVARPGLRQDLPSSGLNSYEYNPEKAANLLMAQGWEKSKSGQWLDHKGETITLSLVASTDYLLVSKVLAKQLESFGFSVDVRLLPAVPFLNTLSKKQYDLALVSQSHQGNIDRFRLMLTGNQGRGDQYFENKSLPLLFKKIDQSTDTVEINLTFADIEKIYNSELPSLPLINPINYSALSDRVEAGFTKNGVAMGIPMVLNKTTVFFEKSPNE